MERSVPGGFPGPVVPRGGGRVFQFRAAVMEQEENCSYVESAGDPAETASA